MFSDAILNSGAVINLANWDKYITLNDRRAADLIAFICAELRESTDSRIDRRYVRQAYAKSYEEGVIASIIWGYPKGRFPGGRSFRGIFAEVESIAGILGDLKSNSPLAASKVCCRFDRFAGLGPSTYTKLLYFSGVEAAEGHCLIYDQMVMRSIAVSEGPDWADLKEKLGNSRISSGRFRIFTPHRQISTYGEYLRTAHRLSSKTRAADDIEFKLFAGAERGRPTPHSTGQDGQLDLTS